MTYGNVPSPDAEKARLASEARQSVEGTAGMQAARQAEAAKASAASEGRRIVGDGNQARSFLDRITGWFKRK